NSSPSATIVCPLISLGFTRLLNQSSSETLTEQKTMAQTLVSLLVHVIFSTKNRADLITPQVEPDLFAYIGGILNNNHSKLLAANGTMNHVHLLVSLGKTISLS